MLWIANLLSVFILSTIVSGLTIPRIRVIAIRKGLFDEPDERKTHHEMVPRLGGTTFMPAVFISVVLLLAVNIALQNHELIDGIDSELMPLIYLSCAIILSYIIGFIDDLKGVRYKTKMLVQVISGIMIAMGEVLFSNLHGFAFVHHLPMYISFPLTVFVVVFIINAINLIDGIDGLASGLCIFAFLYYGVTFTLYGQNILAMLSFASAGVLVPFYYYNVFGKAERGKKIFMGDTGSLTLGIMLSFLSIRLILIQDDMHMKVNMLVLALSPLLIPGLDVVRVFLLRIRNGRNPFLPDRNHIHHKLMAMGMGQRKTMVIIILASVILTTLNVILPEQIGATIIICADILLWTVANILISNKIKTRKTYHND